ncbi:MAG: efflux RND transporter periplasmic adaptor subunit [Betaproteobacteria bacterium]|nr:efflux RND transporter periplasmic adaptor subunit [Betaproteobacteria bacterium]HNE42161.1 efflux RND transporter periplasmic adaptor subunit [Rhodocyclaceae bacterium]HNM21929.1 efflux RND transporter periplasmic adaptor subunit [Rhodocyclaceae bacterium]HNM80403.1 efflux RND transporter periplasmic adaptor subunit [Rhodocyclaceae bacterium]HNP03930.1 efflux RND transporter periplasmic adaptor subunit [Rhodocyclaceae bacterium]
MPLLRRLAIAAILLAVIATLLWWATRPKPIPVVLKEVATGSVESTVSNTRAGTVDACQRTKLSTIQGGRIEFLGVKEGDRVKQGQLLMKLWNDDQQAQAALAQTQIALAEKRVTEACVVAANAEREAERQAKLRAQGFVSVGKEEAARTDAEARRAACATAKADVASAQAKFKATRVEQGRTALYAPFDGIVAKIVGELGEYSTPSPPGVPTPPAIDLIDDTCLYVTAPMDEVDAPKIKPGQPVRISLDALPKQALPGKVRRVAPYVSAVEKQARTVDIEVDFEAPESAGKLLVGYSADVEILLAVRENVLRIPTAALLEGNRVLVYNPETERLDERTVKTGLANWEYTEIADGLRAGDRIVTSLEKEGVKAGARVVPDDKVKAGK